jgi:hypothetical protein
LVTALPLVDFKPEEWWKGHAFLALQIGAMALQHRDIGNTYPEQLTHDEWKNILTRIGEPLIAYAKGIDDYNGSLARETAAKEALELFAQWFMHLWD